MVFLYILGGIVAIFYLLMLCAYTKWLYDQYSKGKAITLTPEDKVVYLCFPVYIPFLLLSCIRIANNKRKYRANKESVLRDLFNGDASRMENFEKFVKSRCGTFDICFYHVLNNLQNTSEKEISSRSMYDWVSNLIILNNVKINKDKISQAAYDILSCYYRKKYNETDTQRIIRLRKVGYNVRPTELCRDEDKHLIRCEYEGDEQSCPKECNACAISIKTEADVCQINNKFDEAIAKYKLVVAQEPQFAEAWNNMASAYGSLGNHKLALEAYLKAVDIDPIYGKAMWGAVMALMNLGREREALTILNDIIKQYDYKEASKLIAELKNRNVTPLPVCRNIEEKCAKQIAMIAKHYGLECESKTGSVSVDINELFVGLFDSFFEYLSKYYKEVNAASFSNICAKFMMLAGMAAAKLYHTEKSRLATEGLVNILSKPKDFFAMDEYCCDYLGIPYVPDKENELSPCINNMSLEAIRMYTDILGQVKSISQIKIAVHDIASIFFSFGFQYIDYRCSHSLPLIFQLKKMSHKDILALRLISVANATPKKVEETSGVAMCYSISRPDPSDYVHYRCTGCGAVCYNLPDDSAARYYQAIRKMGYDCKIERWCNQCCEQNGLVGSYNKQSSSLVFFIRLEQSDNYKMSQVTSYDLEVLYQFLKRDKSFEDCSSIKSSIKIIERLLGITID